MRFAFLILILILARDAIPEPAHAAPAIIDVR